MRQLQQQRTQVVCSNKDARKRLAEALPQWTMDLIANAYTCTEIKEKYNKTHINYGTWIKNTHRETRIRFYRYRIDLVVSLYISSFIQCIQIIIILFINSSFSCILSIEFFVSFYIHYVFGVSLFYLCFIHCFILLLMC